MFGRDCNPVYLFQNCKTTQGSDAEEEAPMNSEQSSSVFDPPNGSNEQRWKKLESNRMAERAAARRAGLRGVLWVLQHQGPGPEGAHWGPA